MLRDSTPTSNRNRTGRSRTLWKFFALTGAVTATMAIAGLLLWPAPVRAGSWVWVGPGSRHCVLIRDAVIHDISWRGAKRLSMYGYVVGPENGRRYESFYGGSEIWRLRPLRAWLLRGW